MSKKIRRNISIDSNVWTKAIAMKLNCSAICEEALRTAVNLKDDEKELLRTIERARQEEAIATQMLKERKENKKIIEAITGGEEAQFNKIHNILIEIYNHDGVLGENHIAKMCNLHNIDMIKMTKSLLDNGAENIIPYTIRGSIKEDMDQEY